MKIVIIGYGKMGKEIEKIALSRGHTISLIIDADNATSYSINDLKMADVAIEFSTPQSAINNINKCFKATIPIVIGTTGWMQELENVKQKCMEQNQTMFYSSNYSIGVNLFFKLNEYLAKLMNNYSEYDITLEEIHHLQKIDAPSGTAISLANQIINENDLKKKWVNKSAENKNELSIISKREADVTGTHTVTYTSEIDKISITHLAYNRKGFALGAVLAAEWIKDKKGIFEMKDLLENSKF